jgi:hypothetical protein
MFVIYRLELLVSLWFHVCPCGTPIKHLFCGGLFVPSSPLFPMYSFVCIICLSGT